jgi:transposase, IS5 family
VCDLVAFMTRRQEKQLLLGELILFGLAMPDPNELMDPELRKLDTILEDEELLDAVVERLRRRHPQSHRRGRKSTPADVVLRLLVLKHLRNWSFERLEWAL